MKQIFSELFAYESLLLIHFCNSHSELQLLFNGLLPNAIDRFLEIYANEDEIKGTKHIELIEALYSNPHFEIRKEYFKQLNISNSSLQRYREKYCTTLKLVISRLLANESLDDEPIDVSA